MNAGVTTYPSVRNIANVSPSVLPAGTRQVGSAIGLQFGESG